MCRSVVRGPAAIDYTLAYSSELITTMVNILSYNCSRGHRSLGRTGNSLTAALVLRAGIDPPVRVAEIQESSLVVHVDNHQGEKQRRHWRDTSSAITMVSSSDS